MLQAILDKLPSRRTATFPTFAVTVAKRFREGVHVRYREANQELTFGGELVGRTGAQVNVEVPGELSEEPRRRIVPNLAQGLATLGFQYVIYRQGDPQAISEDERVAALTTLREMGLAVEVSPDRNRIELTRLSHWPRPSPAEATAVAPRLLRLLGQARGVRGSIEVLARSEAAAAPEPFA